MNVPEKKGVNNSGIEKINNILDQASNGISNDERDTMYRSLESISDNLQKICDKNYN